MRNQILTVCFVLISVIPAGAQTYEEIMTANQQIGKEWETAKKDFAKRFKTQQGLMDKEIARLKQQTDGGSAQERSAINERTSDMERARDSVNQIIHEITAASAVKWSNFQGHLKDSIEDMKD